MMKPLRSLLICSLFAISASLLSTSSVNADVIFADDFESYGVQNPFTGGGVWSTTGPGGANSSRTFDPGGAGSGFSEVGWISIVDGSGLQVTFDFSALAGSALEDGSGNLFDSNVYDLTFVHATETSVASRVSTFDLNLASSGAIAFTSGGNADSSQSLSGLTSQTGTNTGGSLGLSADRQWTMFFSGTGLTTADTLTLDLGRNTSTAGFTWIDNVAVNATVTAVPEPGSLSMLMIAGFCSVLVRRKRQ